MRVLITNRRMEKFGGSELVALELAEELQARGHDVIIYTRFLLDPLKADIKVPVVTEAPDFSTFDVLWAHHNMLGDYLPRPSQRVVFNHMSSYVDLEFPQNARREMEIAERIFANSEETRQVMVRLGLTSCEVFPNPAPAGFKLSHDGEYGLFISNHRPMLIKLLAPQLGCVNRFYGEQDRWTRITPEIIAHAHFVVTNGKSVQYSMRARKPVFLYDHFNGPGWLNFVNVGKAGWFNFSGRCSRDNTAISELKNWREATPVPERDEHRLEWWLEELEL